MNELLATAAKIQDFCERRDWKFCVIGGVAVLRWGQVRATVDVDMTLLTGFGAEDVFVDELSKVYRWRPPCDREFSLTNRVLLLLDDNKTPLDVALGAMPFEERSITRSSLWEARPGVFIRTCSAEDLLIHKCFAGRERDWSDVDGILARQGAGLDLQLVRAELKPLLALKEQPENLPRLEKAIKKHIGAFTQIQPAKPQTEQQ